MAPVCKVLKSKQNDEEWNPACRGALMSALVGRQYPQTRYFAAGWSEHSRCVLCLHDIVQADLAKSGMILGSVNEGSSDIQARAWCSHEGGSPTIGCNSNGLSSCEVLDRPSFASAAADVSRAEQKENVKVVVATADQISRAP